MKKIRKGNTIHFRFSVYRIMEGTDMREPENLSGVDIRAAFRNTLYGNTLDTSFTVEGNVISTIIPAITQTKSGPYNFELQYTKEGNDYAIDKDAFRLVNSSADTGGVDCCPDTVVEIIELFGEISFVGEGASIPQIQSDWDETNMESKAFIKNKPNIPRLPDGLVVDTDYVHTDNNFTTLLLDKLNNASNYDDTTLRQTLQGEINRAIGVEDTLDEAIKKVASDLSLFITGDPNSNNVIDRWQEVVKFLSSISDTGDKSLAQILLDLKMEINAEVVKTLQGYYTRKQVDDTFVKMIVGGRLISASEITKLSNLSNYDDTYMRASLGGKADIIREVIIAGDSATINANTLYVCKNTIGELSITLSPPASEHSYNEYMFEFSSGDTPTTLIMQDTIKWMQPPVIEANKTYQVSIVNNIAVMGGVQYE